MSDRVNDIEQFIDAILVIYGSILGEDEDADLLFHALKKIAPYIEEWLASAK